jgi:photosystem II stability/assembly factor-like uncharacterized protein
MKFKLTLLISAFILALVIPSCKKASTPEYEKYYGWTVGESESHFGMIFHTVDGGYTWIRQGDSLQLPDAGFSDICIINASTLVVVGGGMPGTPAVVYRSSDGGTTWTYAGNGLPHVNINCIISMGGQNLWIVGDSGSVYSSDNLGDTWTKHEVPAVYQNVRLLRIGAGGLSNIWVVGDCYSVDSFPVMLHSVDSANTWKRIEPLQNLGILGARGGHYLGVKVSGNSVWAVGGFGKFVIRSTNDGESWSNLTVSGGAADANDIVLLSDRKAYLVTDYNGIYYTNDAGTNWKDCSFVTGNWYLGVDWLTPLNVWVVGSPGAGQAHSEILYSSNGGNSWIDQTPAFFDSITAGLYKVRFIAVP